MKTVINFFKGLFNETGSVSSKRFTGVVCIVVCAIAFLSNLWFKFYVDHHLFDAFLLFATACFGLNTYLSQKGMAVKENVATDMVNNAGETQDAKDVLQANKP